MSKSGRWTSRTPGVATGTPLAGSGAADYGRGAVSAPPTPARRVTPGRRALGRLLLALALAVAVALPVLRAWHVIHDHGHAVTAAPGSMALPGDATHVDHCSLCLALDARSEALPLDLALPDLPLPSGSEAGIAPFLAIDLTRPVFDRDARGPPISR